MLHAGSLHESVLWSASEVGRLKGRMLSDQLLLPEQVPHLSKLLMGASQDNNIYKISSNFKQCIV